MSDMMRVISDKLKQNPVLSDVLIKAFERPESLDPKKASVILIPLVPPQQSDFGSNRPLRKQFTYQINVESPSKEECSTLAQEVEKVLLELQFLQLSGGLEEYFKETGRFVDARRYRGFSSIYQTNY